MNESSKKYLLKIARESISSALYGTEFSLKRESGADLVKKSGCFVTLTKRGELRGCIGYIEGIIELYIAVYRMARQAAFHDPRFPQIDITELSEIKIEISVLTPLESVKDKEDILIGRDGLFIKKGFYSGLLLPQVAVEWGYDRDKFLQQTCLKAGLKTDCHKDDDTVIYKFSAEIFSEKEFVE